MAGDVFAGGPPNQRIWGEAKTAGPVAKRLVIIDGKSVFYRGYYAMGALGLPDGTPTGGVYGFAAIALEKKLYAS